MDVDYIMPNLCFYNVGFLSEMISNFPMKLTKL